jgi:putative RecB family exonuclease
VSQYNEYEACPHRYYLHRVEEVPERPAAWLVQGLALHESVEFYERSDRSLTAAEVQNIFRASYADHARRLQEVEPNLWAWFASGPYKGPDDLSRRFGIGLEQVAKYLDYTAKTPWLKPWTTEDGQLAVELELRLDFNGLIVKGFVDQVMRHPEKGLVIRDVKSGNQPGNAFQLAVYARALWDTYGGEVRFGDFWMGRTGNATDVFDLSEYPRERIESMFREMDDNVKAGRFDPEPNKSTCMFCPVVKACKYSA